MPCSDMHNSCNAKNNLTNKETSHNHDSDSDDHCSPFCTCSCCSSTVSFIPITTFQIEQTIVFGDSSPHLLLDDAIKSNFFGNIWQPPKIC